MGTAVNDNTTEEARYLALAADASAAADRMKDAGARATMRNIAHGYLAMARVAGNRDSHGVR